MTEGSASTQYALTTSITQAALIAHLSGEIDQSSVDAARAELLLAANALPPPYLAVLDLTDVTFFSAAAVHAVEEFVTASAERGLRTQLIVSPGGVVYRVLSLLGLEERLPLVFSSH